MVLISDVLLFSKKYIKKNRYYKHNYTNIFHIKLFSGQIIFRNKHKLSNESDCHLKRTLDTRRGQSYTRGRGVDKLACPPAVV